MGKLNVETLPLDQYFHQLDLLYQLHDLEQKKSFLKKKLKSMEKKKEKLGINNSLRLLQEFKNMTIKIKNSEKNMRSSLKSSFNLREITTKIEDCNMYLKNIEKSFKKKELESESYEISKLEYEQSLERERKKFQRIQKISMIYYRDLKLRVDALWDALDEIKELKLKGSISKPEYFKFKVKIEGEIDSILSKIKFFTIKVLNQKL